MHVVVDPMLSRIVRPHQREGIVFMYECITGLRVPEHYGCVMVAYIYIIIIIIINIHSFIVIHMIYL